VVSFGLTRSANRDINVFQDRFFFHPGTESRPLGILLSVRKVPEEGGGSTTPHPPPPFLGVPEERGGVPPSSPPPIPSLESFLVMIWHPQFSRCFAPTVREILKELLCILSIREIFFPVKKSRKIQHEQYKLSLCIIEHTIPHNLAYTSTIFCRGPSAHFLPSHFDGDFQSLTTILW